MSTAAVRRYWTRVAALGCLLCGGPAEVAHCHGGSIVPILGVKAKGKKLPAWDYAVIPLCPTHHRWGSYGIALDAGVEEWEQRHGTQAAMIDRLAEHFGINLWELAKGDKRSLPTLGE